MYEEHPIAGRDIQYRAPDSRSRYNLYCSLTPNRVFLVIFSNFTHVHFFMGSQEQYTPVFERFYNHPNTNMVFKWYIIRMFLVFGYLVFRSSLYIFPFVGEVSPRDVKPSSHLQQLQQLQAHILRSSPYLSPQVCVLTLESRCILVVGEGVHILRTLPDQYFE